MTGISQAQISRFKSGENSPSAKNIELLATSLGVSADVLLGKEPLDVDDLLRDDTKKTDEPPDDIRTQRGMLMFKKNFQKICIEKGLKPTLVVEAIGLSASTFSCWTDESVPRKKTLQKIADYLQVTVDDLLRDDTKKTDEPPDDIRTQIGKLLPELTPDELQQVINYADFLRQKKDRP